MSEAPEQAAPGAGTPPGQQAPAPAGSLVAAAAAAPAAGAATPAAAKKKKRPKELAVINQAGCTGCEVCLEVCPVDCMYTVAGPDYDVYKKLVEIDLDVCIGCKLCVKYCPWDTIEMIDSGEAFEIAKEWTLRTVMPQKEWLQGEDIESGGFFPTAFNSDRPAGV